MKLKMLGLLISCCLMGFGQSNFAAVGVSYQPGATPAIAGTALYARQLASDTWSFTVDDAMPTSFKPFTVNNSVATGIAQRLFSPNVNNHKIDIFLPTAAGISWNGVSTGWNWSTGYMAVFDVKGWKISPTARVVKNSVGNNGYAVIGGVLIGWGW